jgi:hypothetical protein
LLTIAVQLGFVTSALLAAGLNLPDLIPPRRLMLVGTRAAAANALLLVADGPLPAIPLRFLTGVALAGVYPPALKAVATIWLIPIARRRRLALGVRAAGARSGVGNRRNPPAGPRRPPRASS